MKKMKTVKLFIYCLFVCYSCSHDKTKTDLIEIKIDPSKVEPAYDVADYVKECDIIALETADDCIIGTIDKVIFKNGIYYILDKKGNSVFLFDSIGRFISKLYKKGGGPDEYSLINTFALENKNIWVADDNLRSLIAYNEDFQMINRFSTMPVIAANHIAYQDGKICLVSNWAGWDSSNMQIGTYDIEKKELTGLWYVPARNSVKVALLGKAGLIAQWGNSCLFTYSYCDTLFQLDNSGFAPKYKMIFSKRYQDLQYPIEDIIDPAKEDIIKGIEDIKQTGHKIFLGYYDKKRFVSAVYDKESGTSQVYSALINSELNVKFWLYETFFDEENVISVHRPDEFLDAFEKEGSLENIKNKLAGQKMKAILLSIDPYSNPVIIRHKLKSDSKL
jgi:hypothetical protein